MELRAVLFFPSIFIFTISVPNFQGHLRMVHPLPCFTGGADINNAFSLCITTDTSTVLLFKLLASFPGVLCPPLLSSLTDRQPRFGAENVHFMPPRLPPDVFVTLRECCNLPRLTSWNV